MRVLSKINPELLEILEWWKDWIFAQDVETKVDLGRQGIVDVEQGTSPEYLEQLKARIHEGYPEGSRGLSLGVEPKQYPEEWTPVVKDLDKKLLGFLGAKYGAVKMYYPKGGFLGWHNNANAPGYNIIMSYTENGDGYFEYEDPDTKKLVRLQDPGNSQWTIKVGYFGGHDEQDKLFWHTARTNEPRLTLAYVIPDQWMWEEMIMDIEDF
jgi:hypothetical protein|tara:strand:- start:419 stop:1048 length:630 start_codon:yes stop_codon:yes gene_type:complete